MSARRGVLVYVVGEFPAASQTFVVREIRTLLQLALPLRVFALGLDRSRPLPEGDEAWARTVQGVPPALSPQLPAAHLFFLRRGPLRARYLRALGALARLPHRPPWLLLRALYVFWRVVPLARRLLAEDRAPRHVHAHFALGQTEAALALAELLGCGFSFTAHARDIYATPNALREKMRAARFVVTCTAYNADHLRRLRPGLETQIHVIRHGVPLPPGLGSTTDAAPRALPGGEPSASRSRAAVSRDAGADAADGGAGAVLPDAPPLVLGAGRLVAKKGFEVLVDACRLLRGRGVAFECAIAGDGPLSSRLARRIERAGLGGHVRLLGWQRPSEMARLYDAASVFVLPSRVVRGGDRDGLPNVLVEALAHGVPVVSTRISAIPELVVDGGTGLLVPPDDAGTLAAALERLLADATLRRQLGEAGRRVVAEQFELEANTRQLARLFEPLLC